MVKNLLAFTFLFILTLTKTFAVTYFVTTTGNDAATGTSWATSYATLQKALDVAVAGDQIWVAKGRFIPTLGTGKAATFKLKNGVAIYGGFAGIETTLLNRNIALIHTINETILSGDINNDDVATDATLSVNKNDNTYRVVSNVTADAIVGTAILNGFTISGGAATVSTTTGAGIYMQGCSPVLQELIVKGNIAANGGGLYLNGSATLTITPVLTNVVVTNNIAVSTGAGIYCLTNASPTITNAIISNNVAQGTSAGNGAGGIYIINSPLGVSPTLTNVEITGNSTGSKGGGLLIWGSSPKIKNLKVTNNTAVNGAGIYITPNGTITFSYPVFTNTLVSGNTASGLGGGIFADRQGFATFTNATIVNNAAVIGAALYDSSNNSKFNNTIIWGNNGTKIIWNGPSNAPGAPVFANSIIQGSRDGNGVWLAENGVDSTSNISADPLFESATSFNLQDLSPARNTGNDALYTGAGGNLATDTIFGGAFRKVGSSIDMGAYENQNAATPVSILNFSAKKTTNSLALIQWAVANEDLAYYQLERSTNGTSFIAINTIVAANLPAYSFTDNLATINSSKIYYRLKLVDNDGSAKYSAIASLNMQANGISITISPVPAKDFVYLYNSDASLNGKPAFVVDMNGKKLYNFTVQAQKSIDISNWAAGVYILKVTGGQSYRIVKE